MIRLNFSAQSNIPKKVTEIDEGEIEEDSLDEDLEDDQDDIYSSPQTNTPHEAVGEGSGL